MNIAEYSIRKRTVTLMITVTLLIGGTLAYLDMGRLEDPEFTIKSAQVITTYPGATPKQVANEITDHIERAVQQMGQLDKITSISKPGVSIITVDIKDKYDSESLPQVWDELRRKVGDTAGSLPPGAGTPKVYDDYGDVYGILYAVTADGYSFQDLRDYVDWLRRELLLVENVAKVTVWGDRTEAVFVEIPRARIQQLGLSVNAVYDALRQRNLVADSGSIRVGPEYVRIEPTGGVTSLESLGDLFIKDASGSRLVRLQDIATISRGFVDPPSQIMTQNGQTSMAVGISLVSGGNIITLGEAVSKRLAELEAETPAGITVEKVYYQPFYVDKAVSSFIVNLGEAVAIVIAVLMVFMGLRSGLLIGAILLVTVCGSFIFMSLMEIQLQRISLGALIIALGMLVDNAIVVTEGMLVRIQQGEDRTKAAAEVVRQNLWPLFGATVIAVMAFSAIGLSQDSTGEFCGSLFYVLLISLMLSWVTAITITPLFCRMFLTPGKNPDADPYDKPLFRLYRSLLSRCLRFRWVTAGVMLLLLGLSIQGFSYVDRSFFPDSTQPQFLIDFWLPEGSDIRETASVVSDFEKELLNDEQVDFTTSFTGSGAPRFMLVYGPENTYANYGQIIATVKDYRTIPDMIAKYREVGEARYPEVFFKFKKIRLGPGRDDPVQVRFSGADPAVLRNISRQAQEIMRADANTRGIRDNWRQKVKLLTPVVSEPQARRAGVERNDISSTLQLFTSGSTIGVYRESDKLLPIIARPPASERTDAGALPDIPIWSPVQNAMIPLSQVVSGMETRFADNVIHTRNRKYTITVSCEPVTGLPSVLFTRLRPQLESLPLPEGYFLEWGGEYEDSSKAQKSLAGSIPLTVVLMILITITLFNALRQPLIIWLTVPLAIIGVTSGLLATGQPFGFMALLGFLSLTGMLIKNAIVLLDQIDLEIREGKPPYLAVLDSSVSRMRPVLMAASTTVLGMMPLLTDAFFIAMAVTIMAGLTFASILTLIVVPTLYVIFFRIKPVKAA